MQFEINWVFCVLVVLAGSSQTRGQSSALPPARTLASLLSHGGSLASSDWTEDSGYEVPQWTHNPAGRDETSTQTTTNADGSVHSETVTNTVTTSEPVVMTAHPAAADNLSSTPTVQSTSPPQHNPTTFLTRDPLTTSSPQPAHTVQETSPTANASTIQPQSESLTTATAQPTTTGHPLTSAAGSGPAGPTHQEVPPELNVGDEDLKGPRYRSSSPLDPLLAGLLSVFIVTTAVVFVILFLKFRQRTNHPEFHRLQDLPMDDLMEDTPLSRYTY